MRHPYAVVLGLIFLSVAFCASARADGLADNHPEKVRAIPPEGIDVPPADRAAIEQQLGRLNAQLGKLAARKESRIRRLLPDVQIFAKAAHDALVYREFSSTDDIERAKQLLDQGLNRADQLLAGNPTWDTASGLIVRGYVSRIDGSVQPYGVVVPSSYEPQGTMHVPLDIWFHGRGETLSEVNFLDEHEHNAGQFTPRGTIVLHPYGRFCNAFKFAGEVDVLEALDSVRDNYRIDRERIAVRGFSMGGAATWHFAVHYAGRWVGANPGAGFAETTEFLRTYQHEPTHPTDYQQKLLHLYDATDWAENLFHCPTVAYSGELDTQKQAADLMEQALKKEHLALRYVIGPGAKHFYEAGAKQTVERIMADIVLAGRDPLPQEIRFTTYTLKYNALDWLTVDGLDEHWQRGEVRAKFTTGNALEVKTKNISSLTFEVPAGRVRRAHLDITLPVILTIDAQEMVGPQPLTDQSWTCSLHKINGKWHLGPDPEASKRKRHDLQGPIDDAFMDSFIFVRPTGHARYAAVESWANSEMHRAITQWRQQFRGEARVKDDTALTDQDIASSNLVLWGDPQSNALLGRLRDKLPIRWNPDSIAVGEHRFAADHHALIMICPNPLNPRRYVVLNSGFTYREYDYLNNARQVPKLPDWAVVDLRTPPGTQLPGKIAAADFFDELWQLPKP
jgi:acetyl esterase/lipase